MVRLLKGSGPDIVMVMKAGLLHLQEEKLESEDADEGVCHTQAAESTNGIAADESCDSLSCLADSNEASLERIPCASPSAESDSDISSPDIIPATRLNLQRTASNPLLDGKSPPVGGARRLSDNLDLEETDGGGGGGGGRIS